MAFKELDFVKMHGLGNDFILIEDKDKKFSSPRLAEFLCDRHFGIGADGLVLLQPSDKALLKMRIFNPDGSEAEMCGNAIRCMARLAYTRGWAKEKEFAIETLEGVKYIEIVTAGSAGSDFIVKVNMGEPILESQKIPVAGENRSVVDEPLEVNGQDFLFTAVSMGNPHCVIFVPDVDAVPLEKWGEQIENNPLFPNKTNVEFVQVISSNKIKVRVWERGAGITLACGTGACASVVAGMQKDLLEGKTEVLLPGGNLFIDWQEHVFMEGAATEVFQGRAKVDEKVLKS